MSAANVLPPLNAARAESVERGLALVRVRGLERAQPVDLILLLGVVGAPQLDDRRRAAARAAERVHADDRQRAVVLALLVEHRLVLDAAALVAGLHRAEHAAPVADPLELASAPPPRRAR